MVPAVPNVWPAMTGMPLVIGEGAPQQRGATLIPLPMMMVTTKMMMALVVVVMIMMKWWW